MHHSEGLAQQLRSLPHKFNYRYTEDAQHSLQELLFFSLAAYNNRYLSYYFPTGLPSKGQPWILSDAQGAVDGAEYSEAARGKRCGHIFRAEEATYSCRTCTTDDTCVLCAKCFEASDHDGHQVYVSLSPGASGCCDCGDPEAWVRPINCGIHTALEEQHGSAERREGKKPAQHLPEDLVNGVRGTISTVFDYMCDVFSCSPEHMRSPKHESAILKDEELARLVADWYSGGPPDSEPCKEFALVLWNDEKHTVDEVEEQVARACSKRKTFGKEIAIEVDKVGRSIVEYSRDLPDLLRKAQILEQIKVTVTIRSSRDLFREQMCHTMVEWLTDVSGCSVDNDHSILMDTVCSEILQPWRIGSNASNMSVAKQGLADHQKSDNRLQDLHTRLLHHRVVAARAAARRARVDIQLVVGGPNRRRLVGVIPRREDTDDENDDDDDDEDDDDDDENDAEDDAEDVLQAELEDEMDLDEALAQDPDLALNEGLRPTDIISVQAGSSAQDDSDGDAGSVLAPQGNPDELLARTERSQQEDEPKISPPAYWLSNESADASGVPNNELPIEENLDKRVRIDFMILYDLRMWKTLRNDLRHLYISTVIKVPRFKRLLGLRFAAVYKVLAQLYLVADREPEHSIINLSLQMLTTPSITAEIIERWNFFTKLLAILYTFLTKRQVGGPEDVDTEAAVAFESGTLTNRRIHHFFNDLKYLLESKFVQDKVRNEDVYLLQLLDFLKLHQGICPNKRAVGEHVEYESDSWITAGMIIRDVIRATRLFCDSFTWKKYTDASGITRAIRQTTKTTIINSTGVESARFKGQELTAPIKFKLVQPYQLEQQPEGAPLSFHHVVDFKVEEASMSFHHILHYTLSWLIECGKSMSRQQLQGLLQFSQEQLERADPHSTTSIKVPDLGPEQYLLALFDTPLRVCAWLAQIKAGMWVRNGVTLRHQMAMYRSVSQRDVSAQRDIFLLQVGLTVCNPMTFLASIIDRYGMSDWMRAEFSINPGWDGAQMVDVAEEFIHLLAVLISDRTLLRPLEEDPNPDAAIARRDIAHALCFKPLSHSDLSDRLTLKVWEMESFDSILREITNYRAPEGLQDSGTFELKDEYFDEVDPYNAFYTKNQREDAEKAWRLRKAKRTGQPIDQVVFEPTLKPVKTGLFSTLSAFTQTPTFAQVIWASLRLCLDPTVVRGVSPTRFEAFLPVVLHLVLVAIAEDKSFSPEPQPTRSFTDAALHTKVSIESEEGWRVTTILSELCDILSLKDIYETCRPKIRVILQRMKEKRLARFNQVVVEMGLQIAEENAGSAPSRSAQELMEKKKRAQERQAKMMASMQKQQNDFLKSQSEGLGLEDDWTDVGDDIEMTDDGVKSRSWSFPKDTCIFCQEETDEQRLYGSLAYMTKSRIFRTTDLGNHDHISEVGMTPTTYDRQDPGLRPFGIARQNAKQVSKVTETGELVTTERRGLGKGWSPDQTTEHPVSTSCGHLMHYSCFEAFNSATERRQNFQIARNHPERLDLQEFVCPLCKALGNSFLPIIWRPKDLIHSETLVSGPFDQWITNQAPFLVSRVFDQEAQKREMTNYMNEAFVANYTPALAARYRASGMDLPGAWPGLPAFLREGGAPLADSSSEATVKQQQKELLGAYHRLKTTMRSNRLFLRKEYPVSMSDPVNGSEGEEVLADALASSIAATELAHRGSPADGEGGTVVDTIPASVITHLRVMSETCSSYTALASNAGKSGVSHKIALILVSELFGEPSPPMEEMEAAQPQKNREQLLNEDIFSFLTSSLVFVVPFLRLDTQHIVRLCVVAEITKVTLAFLENYGSINAYVHEDVAKRTDQRGAQIELEKARGTSAELQNYSIFVQNIIGQVTENMGPLNEQQGGVAQHPFPDLDANPNSRFAFDGFARAGVMSYLLPFLRKTVLLLHVRGGVDFQSANNVKAGAPELDRLTALLGLPSVNEMIESCVGRSGASHSLQELVSHWIWDWMQNRHQRSQRSGAATRHTQREAGFGTNEAFRTLFPTFPGTFPEVPLTVPGPDGETGSDIDMMSDDRPATTRGAAKLRLSHPGVYELIALPAMHDTLNALTISHRCPTTGGPINEPNLCLLCGEMLCGQSSCCAVETPAHSGNRTGGCYRHQAGCGGSIGMYLNVRRCAILFLNGMHGSWFAAPYLDRHGEVDVGLKRRGRLYLNEWRYEKGMRQVWLEHGVQSAVARKLEGDVNSGGWETL